MGTGDDCRARPSVWSGLGYHARYCKWRTLERGRVMPPQNKPNPLSDYVTVAERIMAFYQAFPDGRICTSIVHHDLDLGFILMRAEVYRHADDTLPAATGHAYELRNEGYVQRTSYIEVG